MTAVESHVGFDFSKAGLSEYRWLEGEGETALQEMTCIKINQQRSGFIVVISTFRPPLSSEPHCARHCICTQ